MNAPFKAQPKVDLLSQAIEFVRPQLDRSMPLKERAHTFWSGVASAIDLAAADVIETEFYQLAIDTGLAADFGKHADETLRHLIRWGIAGRNPYW